MNKIQIALMQSLGLNQDTPLDIIEDKVSEYLEKMDLMKIIISLMREKSAKVFWIVLMMSKRNNI